MYSLYITPRPSLQSYTMHAGRGGGLIYREYTECYSISFLFLFFFHQSSLYPIKIFAKCFYLLVCILFSAPTLSELKLIIINKYLVHVLVLLLHARFSVVGPIPFLLAAIFFLGPSLYRKYYHTSRYHEVR